MAKKESSSKIKICLKIDSELSEWLTTYAKSVDSNRSAVVADLIARQRKVILEV